MDRIGIAKVFGLADLAGIKQSEWREDYLFEETETL